MQEITQQDKTGIAGKYRIHRYKPIDATLEEVPLDDRERVSTSEWIDNLVVSSTTTGIGLITSRLIGQTTYDLAITQAKIGTGTTAPVNADTDLETTVLAGILRAKQSATATTATIEFFISGDDIANGNYTEFGIFAGTRLFARSIISPTFSKSTAEDVGIEYIITISNT